MASHNEPVQINHWLPYCAVFQADVRQTLNSWVYRCWVGITVLVALGFLLYHVGVYRGAGIVQLASTHISDLMRWTILGSVTLIIVLTAGSISGERGTLADSVLSRGISRYHYFLGKWHARLVTVLGTFLVMGMLALGGSYFFLHEDLSLRGSLVALGTVLALLAAVVTCGVSVSAVCNSTVLGITVLWILVYGGGFLLTILPAHLVTSDWALASLPNILRGHYDPQSLGRLAGYAGLASAVSALIGMVQFSRRDV